MSAFDQSYQRIPGPCGSCSGFQKKSVRRRRPQLGHAAGRLTRRPLEDWATLAWVLFSLSFPMAVRGWISNPISFPNKNVPRHPIKLQASFARLPGARSDGPIPVPKPDDSAEDKNSSLKAFDGGPLMNLRPSTHGLSRFHQSILARTSSVRQCFVTGRYPLTVTFRDCPTRKWLRWESNSELLVNETSISKSAASLDRWQWLDCDQELHTMISMEFLAEIHLERPGYLQILPSNDAGVTAALVKQQQNPQGAYSFFPKPNPAAFGSDLAPLPVLPTDRLWVTGFSISGRKGHIYSVEADTGEMETVNKRTQKSLLWPNEVSPVPAQVWATPDLQSQQQSKKVDHQDALLVADGFLVPGKDHGGLYIVKNPGNPDAEWTLQITPSHDRWFYHRASWVDLTGDGRLSLLTARCKVSTRFPGKDSVNDGITSGISKEGQLVFLECPQPHRIDSTTGTPLDQDGTVFDPFAASHLPWKEHVLAHGPDVMFCLADMDPTDDTVEVLCSEFFNKQVTLRSIRKGPKPQVVFDRVIDGRCGAAFGCIPANLQVGDSALSSLPIVVDSGSTVPCLKEGDHFSHLLVTSHECAYAETVPESNDPEYSINNAQEVFTDSTVTDGGSVFAYRVPTGKGAWKTQPWIRSTVATGFKVHGQLGNMINPGAPGFVYVFHAKENETDQRPLIAVAGDCAESAFLFRPDDDSSKENIDSSTSYKLMAEIKCGATVGSIAIGYDDFLSAEQESGYAKMYIPCFEKDKILVFALGSGDDGMDDDCGW